MATETAERMIADHHELLHAARNLYFVASLGESDTLTSGAGAFLSTLEEHLREEAASFVKLAPGEARILEHGQRHLASLARALGARAAVGCAESGGQCRELAEELLARCFLQVRDEGSALRGDRQIEPDNGCNDAAPRSH